MLPFCVKRLLAAGTYGSLLAEDQGLKFVWQKAGSEELNPLDADVRSVTIPWAQVSRMQSNRGMLSTTLAVELVEAVDLSLLPFADQHLLTLTIRSKDSPLLDPFLKTAQSRRAGEGSSDTDEFIDDMRDFLWDL